MTNKDGHPNLSDVTIAREILVPVSNPDNRYFFLTDDGQKIIDKKQVPTMEYHTVEAGA